MAKNTTISLTLSTTGDGLSVTYVPPGMPLNYPAVMGGVPLTSVVLSAGNNTLNVPSGANYLLIMPPAASGNAKRILGTGTDLGFQISNVNVGFFPLASGASTVLINSAGTETISIVWV